MAVGNEWAIGLVVGDGKYTETASEEAAIDVKYIVINGKYVIVWSGVLVPVKAVSQAFVTTRTTCIR